VNRSRGELISRPILDCLGWLTLSPSVSVGSRPPDTIFPARSRMALQEVNPALFVVAVEGIAQRGRGKIDTLQIYFLQMLARRARQLGDNFWPGISPRESQYLSDAILASYQQGVIGEDHMLAHALGVGRQKPANGAAAAEAAESLTRGVRRTMTPSTEVNVLRSDEEETRPEMKAFAGGPASQSAPAIPASEERRAVVPDPTKETKRPKPETPVQLAAAELRDYQLALLERDSFKAQKAWRRFEKAIETLNPRVSAFAKVVGVSQLMATLGESLPDAEALINEPGKTDTERLRAFMSHAKGLAKLLHFQVKAVDDALGALPDPDVLLKRR
jgi:hypothetical protein